MLAIRPTGMTLEEVSRTILDCYRRYYMWKAPEYYAERDSFRQDYLKRSMHLHEQLISDESDSTIGCFRRICIYFAFHETLGTERKLR